MMRSFIVLLLLIVVFLTGMLIGIEREGGIHANQISPEVNVAEQTGQLTHWEAYDEVSTIEKQLLDMEGPEQTTQKVAAFLEAGVKGFYEVVVEILFQISSFFV